MKSYGISRRGNEKSQAVRNGTYVNESFFSSWHPDMTYVLGYGFADGYISTRGYVFEITSVDREILDKMAIVMGYTKELRTEEPRGRRKRPYKLTVHKKRMYDDLLCLGMTPRKSFTVRMPTCIPPEYEQHFIRGYFDGNGSVHRTDLHYKSKTYPRLGISITTASEGMAYDLQGCLGRHLSVEPKVNRASKDRDSTLYHVLYHDQSLVREFYEWMYHDVPNQLWMDRKYRKFADFYSEGQS